jgi:ribosomal protein L13
MHDLSISNGQIVSFGANYAIINADDGCVLVGKKYEHKQITKRKTNPLTLTTDTENIVSVKNATLVSSNNVDKLLEKCYNYLVITNQVNLDIVENKNNDPVNVGDLINVETEYSGDVNGRVIKQSFNLNGGIIIKKTTMRGTI